jgi:hypothetical protein
LKDFCQNLSLVKFTTLFFGRLYVCMVQYLSFHNSKILFKCEWQGQCDTPFVILWLVLRIVKV